MSGCLLCLALVFVIGCGQTRDDSLFQLKMHSYNVGVCIESNRGASIGSDGDAAGA